MRKQCIDTQFTPSAPPQHSQMVLCQKYCVLLLVGIQNANIVELLVNVGKGYGMVRVGGMTA